MIEPPNKEIRNLLLSIKIKKIMTARVYSVHERNDLSMAEKLFVENNLTHLPVTDEHNKVIGLLSHMFIYKTQAPRRFVEGEMTAVTDMIIDGDGFYLKENLDRYHLSNIMKKNPLTLNQEESLAKAVEEMAMKKVGCIPIVDDLKNLVGIITNQDIINFLAMTLV